MPGILDGLRIVEGSAFVAAPLGGMTLAQLGAEVIRFDPIGGGLDRRRWPVTTEGRSLFWAGLNKGKRSIQVDLACEAGRELVAALITAPGPDAGLFLTNFPARGFLDYDRLAERRADLIMVNIVGNYDGDVGGRLHGQPGHGLSRGQPARAISRSRSTICCPPGMRSPGRWRPPVCWRPNARALGTGAGQYVRIALSDVAFWMVGNLGKIAEVQINRHERVKDGNYLYGAFGRDFATKDGHRVMIVALTLRQWRNLVEATGLQPALDAIARLMDVDLDEEGGRFAARELIGATLKPWVLARTLDEAARHLRRATAFRGARTRRSRSWSSAIHAARRPTRCSRRSSSQASGPT